MTFKSRVVPKIALALAASLFVPFAWAQAPDKPESAAIAKFSAAEQAMYKFSETGNSAMRSIRGARLAIFNGEPIAAIKLMESAKALIEQAQKGAPTFDTTSKVVVGGAVLGTSSDKSEITSVPVDGQVVLADDFVPTPEKQAHIDKANEHIKKGDTAKAIEELLLGEIDVTFNQSWMPMAASIKHIDQAIKLAAQDKYYESSLSLKAIEDSVTVNSIHLHDLPQHSGK